ncbi:carbonic anhydrase [Streptomyces sp. HUAS TT7]|uniref:carbonic anhydrase n=1 Tax=Streptomyces sp. HUAS TT7 TaxID=3447507 RepID=UPI003F6582EE
MKSLIDKTCSFSATHMADPRHAELFQASEAGQAPQVLFITCSDSRVVPTLITGALRGEFLPPHAPVRSPATASAGIAEAVQAHALAQLETLRGYSCVQERIDAGTLSLHTWHYDVHTGAVRAQQAQDGGLSFKAL